MRKTLALATALALAAASLPAFAGAPQHKKYIPSVDELVADYATQIAAAPPATITVALTKIASPSASFDATAATAAIEAAVGTPSFISTAIAQVNAAIAAHQAAIGPNYVVEPQSFFDAAMAAKKAGTTP